MNRSNIYNLCLYYLYCLCLLLTFSLLHSPLVLVLASEQSSKKEETLSTSINNWFYNIHTNLSYKQMNSKIQTVETNLLKQLHNSIKTKLILDTTINYLTENKYNLLAGIRNCKLFLSSPKKRETHPFDIIWKHYDGTFIENISSITFPQKTSMLINDSIYFMFDSEKSKDTFLKSFNKLKQKCILKNELLTNLARKEFESNSQLYSCSSVNIPLNINDIKEFDYIKFYSIANNLQISEATNMLNKFITKYSEYDNFGKKFSKNNIDKIINWSAEFIELLKSRPDLLTTLDIEKFFSALKQSMYVLSSKPILLASFLDVFFKEMQDNLLILLRKSSLIQDNELFSFYSKETSLDSFYSFLRKESAILWITSQQQKMFNERLEKSKRKLNSNKENDQIEFNKIEKEQKSLNQLANIMLDQSKFRIKLAMEIFKRTNGSSIDVEKELLQRMEDPIRNPQTKQITDPKYDSKKDLTFYWAYGSVGIVLKGMIKYLHKLAKNPSLYERKIMHEKIENDILVKISEIAKSNNGPASRMLLSELFFNISQEKIPSYENISMLDEFILNDEELEMRMEKTKE
ncbi:MAG: hypothetical protein HQK49_18855 [Oligoflexia bacterium]|nr:hypothetical protein [Oligoflexia bacterium]